MNNSKVKIPVRKQSTPFGKGHKGRTSRTNQNKLRQLKSFYNGLFKRSQKNKKTNPNKTKYFCDRFTTFDSFAKYCPLKQATPKR